LTVRGSEFDFAAFKSAFEGNNFQSWAPFYADGAEWIEYRHFSPPRSPNWMLSISSVESV